MSQVSICSCECCTLQKRRIWECFSLVPDPRRLGRPMRDCSNSILDCDVSASDMDTMMIVRPKWLWNKSMHRRQICYSSHWVRRSRNTGLPDIARNYACRSVWALAAASMSSVGVLSGLRRCSARLEPNGCTDLSNSRHDGEGRQLCCDLHWVFCGCGSGRDTSRK